MMLGTANIKNKQNYDNLFTAICENRRRGYAVYLIQGWHIPFVTTSGLQESIWSAQLKDSVWTTPNLRHPQSVLPQNIIYKILGHRFYTHVTDFLLCSGHLSYMASPLLLHLTILPLPASAYCSSDATQLSTFGHSSNYKPRLTILFCIQ